MFKIRISSVQGLFRLICPTCCGINPRDWELIPVHAFIDRVGGGRSWGIRPIVSGGAMIYTGFDRDFDPFIACTKAL